MTVQATHAITVPTSSSTRSPITAPSALVIGFAGLQLLADVVIEVVVCFVPLIAGVCTAELKVWHVMTKLAISHMRDCIVSPQFRVVPSSVIVQSTFGSIEEVVLFAIAPVYI